ncbi:MAG: sigma-54 dependent transcriptional regulator [Proteobacteria bacterium]|nr:sigma-54 dependent transcriptional regulator [Pseudomonadota bacterium]
MNENIMIVDDDKSLREVLEIILKKEGYNVYSCEDGKLALQKIIEDGLEIDAVITDILMPNIDGLTLIQKLKKFNPDIPIIVITANTNLEVAIEALKEGAYDYITKPFKNDELKMILRNAIEKSALLRENLELKNKLKLNEPNIIFNSKIMEELYMKALVSAKTSVPVLIIGESGTGKELFARLIHRESGRASEPFFAVNCAAIPENLMESEFFGFERGAFTGASLSKPGYFELANRGTLFLDEIGDLPLSLQVKLLRAIEEKKVLRLGGKEPFEVDVRIVAATNKDLDEEVKRGNFREDLYYRLNVLKLHIPPLRDRKEDILTLSMYFLRKFCISNGRKIQGFTKDAINILENYSWPGNVRELQNVIERACVFETGNLIGLSSIPVEILESVKNIKKKDTKPAIDTITFSNFNLDDYLNNIEYELVSKALTEAQGNKKVAAEKLGISLWSLYRRIEKFKKDNLTINEG